MNPEPSLSTPSRQGLPDLSSESLQDESPAPASAPEDLEQLRRQNRLLHSLMAEAPDAVYFKDLDSRFLLASDYTARRLGLVGGRDLVGKSDFDLFSPEHAQKAFDDEQEIIRTGCPIVNKEEREVFPNGQVAWVSSTKLPLFDEQGSVIGTFGISRDITARKEMELVLTKTQAELNATTRLAEIAEISSGALHNIGNALNSVLVSASMVTDHMGKSRIGNLAKAVQMIKDNEANLGSFLTEDPKGKQLPGYLMQLSQVLAAERDAMAKEFEQLRKSVEHIKEIVVMQQNYSRVSQFEDDVELPQLVEEALRISEGSLNRHSIHVETAFEATPKARVVRHKVLQILVNLIRNAKFAMDEAGVSEKRLLISVRRVGEGRIETSVRDNGVGISAEVMSKLFGFGFTTRKDGHGFGLHSSLKAAKEMGGELRAESEGPGRGACFILSLPCKV
jgi:PAS domain S-box-containing protein